MRLTLFHRLMLCCEILTTKSGHKHSSDEKQLSVFIRGYQDGLKDGCLECQETIDSHMRRAALRARQVSHELTGTELRDNIERAVLNTTGE